MQGLLREFLVRLFSLACSDLVDQRRIKLNTVVNVGVTQRDQCVETSVVALVWGLGEGVERCGSLTANDLQSSVVDNILVWSQSNRRLH